MSLSWHMTNALIAIVITILVILLVYGLQFVFAEEELACLIYSDGTYAEIDTGYLHNCDERSQATISWLLQKGYEIDAVTAESTGFTQSDGRVYMSR